MLRQSRIDAPVAGVAGIGVVVAYLRGNVIALKKILKAVDVWLMSARWWTSLQRNAAFDLL